MTGDTITLTAEEFATSWTARSGLTLEEVLKRRHVVVCGPKWGCVDPLCEGWAMVPLDWTNTNGVEEQGNAVAWPVT